MVHDRSPEAEGAPVSFNCGNFTDDDFVLPLMHQRETRGSLLTAYKV